MPLITKESSIYPSFGATETWNVSLMVVVSSWVILIVPQSTTTLPSLSLHEGSKSYDLRVNLATNSISLRILNVRVRIIYSLSFPQGAPPINHPAKSYPVAGVAVTVQTDPPGYTPFPVTRPPSSGWVIADTLYVVPGAWANSAVTVASSITSKSNTGPDSVIGVPLYNHLTNEHPDAGFAKSIHVSPALYSAIPSFDSWYKNSIYPKLSGILIVVILYF